MFLKGRVVDDIGQMGTEPVQLCIAKGVAYVWNVDDISILRAKYRVCGILTGTLPQLSQQNVFLGVPLVLMPEEVVLLVEMGMPDDFVLTIKF